MILPAGQLVCLCCSTAKHYSAFPFQSYQHCAVWHSITKLKSWQGLFGNTIKCHVNWAKLRFMYNKPSSDIIFAERLGYIFFVIGICNAPHCPVRGSSTRIQTVEVVVMAAMVPIGMDFWASRRSPERLEPAMIPGKVRCQTTIFKVREIRDVADATDSDLSYNPVCLSTQI